jgi:hypothetical protein
MFLYETNTVCGKPLNFLLIIVNVQRRPLGGAVFNKIKA